MSPSDLIYIVLMTGGLRGAIEWYGIGFRLPLHRKEIHWHFFKSASESAFCTGMRT